MSRSHPFRYFPRAQSVSLPTALLARFIWAPKEESFSFSVPWDSLTMNSSRRRIIRRFKKLSSSGFYKIEKLNSKGTSRMKMKSQNMYTSQISQLSLIASVPVCKNLMSCQRILRRSSMISCLNLILTWFQKLSPFMGRWESSMNLWRSFLHNLRHRCLRSKPPYSHQVSKNFQHQVLICSTLINNSHLRELSWLSWRTNAVMTTSSSTSKRSAIFLVSEGSSNHQIQRQFFTTCSLSW